MHQRKSFAQIGTMFKKFVIDHPKAATAMRFMEDLREWKRLSEWYTEAAGAYLLAPSQSGKTHTVTTAYYKKYLLPQCRASNEFTDDVSEAQILLLQKSVVYVKLPAKPQLGATATAILKALHHPRASKGTVGERLDCIETLLANAKTELLILDSYDHLTKTTNKRTIGEATETQDTLKLLMEKGTPMLFVGLESAKEDILADEQLQKRMFEINFEPLSIANSEDVMFYRKYIQETDILTCCGSIFEQSSDLFGDDTLNNLFLSTNGQYGMTSNLIRDAAILSSAEGHYRIEVEHLSRAVTSLVGRRLLQFNPFSNGSDIDIRRAA